MPFKYYMLKCGQFQLILWPLYLPFINYINSVVDPKPSSLSIISISVILVVLVNVGLLISYPIMMMFAERWREVWSVPLTILVFAGLIYIAVYVCYPLFSGNPSDAESIRTPYDQALIMIHKAFFAFIVVAWISSQVLSKYNARKANEAQEIRHQQELESKRLEYQFLSAQVNPHFLSNMINQLILECEEMMPQSAARMRILGELTRFLIDIGGLRSITIAREIEALENYLALQMMHFPDCQINFIGKEHVGGERIVPGALIIILENVFKHGIFQEPENPVEIRLESSYSSLLFTCSNRIDKFVRAKESTKLGIANIRKRLDLVFPNKYRFETAETSDGWFRVELEIEQS